MGSGPNYNKRGLRELIRRICSGEVGRLVVTHKDRLLRFGSELVFSLCEHFGTEVVIINASEEATFEEELVQDVLEIITVFSARLYGSRSRKNRDIMKMLKEAADAICPEVRLEAGEHTAAVLDGQSRIANWLYNHLLEEANTLREKFRSTQDPEAAKVLYTERGLRNRIPVLKKEYPFLRTVYSSVLKNAALRVSGAIRKYQKARREKGAKRSAGGLYRPGGRRGGSLPLTRTTRTWATEWGPTGWRRKSKTRGFSRFWTGGSTR